MRKATSRAVLVTGLVLVMAAAVVADEGMWPLYALDKLDFAALKARGLELGPDEVFNEKDGGVAAAICQVGGGTGSFVSPDGLILTNHHVLDRAEKVTVSVPGVKRKYPAQIVGTDMQTDIALLRIESDTPLPAARFGSTEDVRTSPAGKKAPGRSARATTSSRPESPSAPSPRRPGTSGKRSGTTRATASSERFD